MGILSFSRRKLSVNYMIGVGSLVRHSCTLGPSKELFVLLKIFHKLNPTKNISCLHADALATSSSCGLIIWRSGWLWRKPCHQVFPVRLFLNKLTFLPALSKTCLMASNTISFVLPNPRSLHSFAHSAIIPSSFFA